MNGALFLEEQDLSHLFDETLLQESWGWRNVTSAKNLACTLINEKGDLDKKALFHALEQLKERLYPLTPGKEGDAPRMLHLLHTLEKLYDSEELKTQLLRIKVPHQHEGALSLIRRTLGLRKGGKVTDGHARRAVLSALLTSLRQNVGSCFATAPAIMIQQQQPLRFFHDMGQLLGIGALRRVVEGVEFAVPLSISFGNSTLYFPFHPHLLGKEPFKALAKAPGLKAACKAAGVKGSCEELLRRSWPNMLEGVFTTQAAEIIERMLLTYYELKKEDVTNFQRMQEKGSFYQMYSSNRAIENYLENLKEAKAAFTAITENPLLKAWEFTLASFSEIKADFAKWNLYASLGVQVEEPGGIGESLHRILSEKLERINKQLAEQQSRYDHTFAQVKMMESRMRSVETEKEANWLRAEYQIRRADLESVIGQHERLQDKGEALARIYPFLIDFYTKKFIDFFQEVYDPEMQDFSANPYDDSPAGFRLLYKHGRSHTSSWTLIYTPVEFINALSSFFVATERDLTALPEMKPVEQEVGELTAAIIATLQNKDFLPKAMARLAKAYHLSLVDMPLENLDKVERKPWAYISGGTLETLINAYYARNTPLEVEKRWVESELELLVFYLDLLKNLKLTTLKHFTENPEFSLLAFSPTHAFLLKPGSPRFRKGWENDAYTYSWVRDHWVVPMQAFLDQTKLETRMLEEMTNHLAKALPEPLQKSFLQKVGTLPLKMTAPLFREWLFTKLQEEGSLLSFLPFLETTFDELCYSALPFFEANDLERRLHLLFERIDAISGREFLRHLEEIEIKPLLSSRDLRLIAQNLLQKEIHENKSSLCFPALLQESMQELGFAYPAPILFADTNWVKRRFGFLVGPATEKLELWIFDDLTLSGRPLTLWNDFLRGQIKESWGVYTNPDQYN